MVRSASHIHYKRPTPVFLGALFVGMLSAATTLPQVVKAHDLDALSPICLGKLGRFPESVSKIEEAGYLQIDNTPDFWLEGQLAHIALAELQFAGADGTQTVWQTYQSHAVLAAQGTLFRTDVRVQNFVNRTLTVAISFAEVDGALSCSIAYAANVEPPSISLPINSRWDDPSGTHIDFLTNEQSAIDQSILSNPWDDWLEGRRLSSSFVVISQ